MHNGKPMHAQLEITNKYLQKARANHKEEEGKRNTTRSIELIHQAK
jgi:hypothetical protein